MSYTHDCEKQGCGSATCESCGPLLLIGGSALYAPIKERWLFMCTECCTPKLMPAIPQNREGQDFHCAVCLEKTFFVRLNLQPPVTFSLP
jgi:hypothetical protein